MPPLPPVSSEEVQNSRRSEEHTSELQSQSNLVCRLLLEKKKNDHRPDRWSIPKHVVMCLVRWRHEDARPGTCIRAAATQATGKSSSCFMRAYVESGLRE